MTRFMLMRRDMYGYGRRTLRCRHISHPTVLADTRAA